MAKDAFNNLPGWAIAEGFNPQKVSRLIRQTPALQLLGKELGVGKVYTAKEWAVIREAMTKRTDRRKSKATPEPSA